MAVVTIIFGPVGGGKTMFATWLMRRYDAEKRRQYCTYQSPYARPLLSLAHAWCEEFNGSDFTVDESGSSYSARETKELDTLAFGALSHARHQDVRVRFITQHPAFLEIQFRRLCEVYIKVNRRGPSGEYARTHPECPWWKRPYWFTARFYKPADFDQETCNLTEFAKPYKKVRFWFDKALAASYDSFNHVVPSNLQDDYDALKIGARVCADLPKYQFLNGRPLPREVVAEDVVWPVPAVQAAKRFKAAAEHDAQRIRLRFLESIGYFPQGAAPADSMARFVVDRAADEYLPLSGVVQASRVSEEVPEAAEILVDDQWVVLPSAFVEGGDIAMLTGRRVRLTLARYGEHCALSLSHPVKWRK